MLDPSAMSLGHVLTSVLLKPEPSDMTPVHVQD